MTTPIDSTSPFGGSTISSKDVKEASTDTEEFSIHTMQDDLLDLQKKAATPQEVTDALDKKKITPIPTPEPQKKTIDTKDMAPEDTRPFVEQVAVSKKKELVEIPLPTKKDAPANTKGYKTVLIVAISLLIVAILFGVYYFLIKRTPKQQVVSNVETAQPIENQENNTSLATDVSTKKYSSEKPNYLTIDIATLSPEDIEKAITDTVEELKLIPENQNPYEFIIVDTNNNPIAFPIFATAAKLNLSPSVLNSLGENFSLFLYSDNGNWRLSFVTDITKKEVLASELSKQEKTFVADASFLFLDEKPEITKGLFQSNNYKNIPIRFFNVNSQITMSIDYAIVGNKLVVATSKDTVRVIIDQLLAAEVTTINTPTNDSSSPASTPEVMSPDQISGNSAQATNSTDTNNQ